MIGNTTYNMSFTATEGLTKAQSFRPSPKYLGSHGISETLSSYKIDFVPHKVNRFQPAGWQRNDFFKRMSHPMEGLTTYRLNYDAKMGGPAPSAKPKAFAEPNTLNFDGRTTYNTMFQPWCLPCTKSFKPEDRFRMENCNVCTPFKGITIYKVSQLLKLFEVTQYFENLLNVIVIAERLQRYSRPCRGECR